MTVEKDDTPQPTQKVFTIPDTLRSIIRYIPDPRYEEVIGLLNATFIALNNVSVSPELTEKSKIAIEKALQIFFEDAHILIGDCISLKPSLPLFEYSLWESIQDNIKLLELEIADFSISYAVEYAGKDAFHKERRVLLWNNLRSTLQSSLSTTKQEVNPGILAIVCSHILVFLYAFCMAELAQETEKAARIKPLIQTLRSGVPIARNKNGNICIIIY